MRVDEVMTKTVVTATPESTFQHLVDLMVRHGISGIPVVDDDHRPVGIVTEADLLAKEAFGTARHRMLDVLTGLEPLHPGTWGKKAEGVTARDVMTKPVSTVRRDDPVSLAAATMVSTRVKRLPVVDEDRRLVGIVSRADVLGLFHRTDDELDLDVKRFLDDPYVGLGAADVTASVHDGIVTLHGLDWVHGGARVVAAVRHHVPGVVDVVMDGERG